MEQSGNRYIEKKLIFKNKNHPIVAPPSNNLIMSGTSTRSFRHLEHQNPSIIEGDIGRASQM